MRDFLARYERGEHGVWDELVRHAEIIAQNSELHEEVRAVARALMKRVRHNADVLRATLIAAGARLGTEHPPATDADLARISRTFGPLPIALDAFWRVAGSITLLPNGTDLYDYGPCALEDVGISLLALDPLDVCGPDVDWLLDEYEEQIEAGDVSSGEPLLLDLAPDFLHKQNISGGAYALTLPPSTLGDAIDPEVLDLPYGRKTFVGYLRMCFAWGGFPLLQVAGRPREEIHINERIAFERVAGSWHEAAERLRTRLSRDLLAF